MFAIRLSTGTNAKANATAANPATMANIPFDIAWYTFCAALIAIIIGIIFLIILCALILKGNKNDETKDTLKVKVQPITKGRSYPWFYVKECLYYFPITALSEYEGETKQTLIDELAEVQKTANFEKVIEKIRKF